MLVRIQSSEGTKRVEVSPAENIQLLYAKASTAFGVEVGSFKLYQDRLRQREVVSSGRRTIKGAKLGHGDMLYLYQPSTATTASASDDQMEVDAHPTETGTKSKTAAANNCNSNSQPSTSSSSSNSLYSSCSSSNNSSSKRPVVVVEDLVDQELSKEDGRIPGKKNPQLCRHKGNSRCIYCTDVDPWDENYQKNNNIKHMSFQTYLRKLKSGVDKGKFAALSSLDCSIKSGCTDHPPWPQGICSSCQPSAVTLTRQTFRHVDTVVFENRAIVEDFLTYWRTTGHQRCGLLYGRHVVHRDVPLGVRAEIAAIYEPPQEATADHIRLLLPDNNKQMVDEIAGQLGLRCCGWVFTDLVPLDASSGTVRHLRHSDTFFLSSHEVITAATLQLQHPNTCALARAGSYGSKFATVIITGDKDNQVHMEGYQVSHQCEALVAANCLLPTLDVPQLAYVKESSTKQYVPDVFFKEKDEYGNEVCKLGRPLPVEYLLLDLPVSTPNTPSHTFTERTQQGFPVENRLVEGHLQDFSSLARHLRGVMRSSASPSDFLTAVSDFHLLLYLAAMDVLPLRHEMLPLLEAVRNKDPEAAMAFKKSDTWGTLEQLMESAPMDTATAGPSSNGGGAGAAGPSTSGGSGGGGEATWTCAHCTFINQKAGGDVCEMCHLPR